MPIVLDPVVNFGEADVAQDLGTTIVLAPGQGAQFTQTTPYNMVYWVGSLFQNPARDPRREIIRVTGGFGTDTLTVLRAQEGRTQTAKGAPAFPNEIGRVSNALTKKTIDDIMALAGGGGGQGTQWTTRMSVSHDGFGSNWKSVTYGNGLFVAVSATGTNNGVMTSPDGITWTLRTSSHFSDWQSVTYGNGLFVAVNTAGAGDQVMTSPDGITWTQRVTVTSHSWSSVTYGNGLFVAVSDTGALDRVMTSPDGITWTIRTSAANSNWQSVTYGNGLFVAVANLASPVSRSVMTSPDGITWTLRGPSSNRGWQSVTYGNGLFVALDVTPINNRVMTSPDGILWTNQASAAEKAWQSVTYGNGIFVAVSGTDSGFENGVMTS